MVEMTVALPLWKSKSRGWLALESLVRQKDIPCEWELVICEEPEECMGEKGLERYKKGIKRIKGKIKYIPLQNWIPLSLKWLTIFENSDAQSKYFLLQAGDCFSQPYRLADTYEIFEKTGANWVQSPVGYFYFIKYDQLYIYDRYKMGKNKPIGETALNMAVSMKCMKVLPHTEKKAGVDGWLYESIKKHFGSIKVTENDSDHWKQGFDSHGLNQISTVSRTKRLQSEAGPFTKVNDVRIENVVDQTIIDRMKYEYQRISSKCTVPK